MEGGHRTDFIDRGGDTAQNQSRLLAGWVAGSMIIVPILAPSCKLKLARFSAKLIIQDGAKCGNISCLKEKTRCFTVRHFVKTPT